MKCTKIGGSEIANARVTFAGGITYLVSGKENIFQEHQTCENVVKKFKVRYFVSVRILWYDHLLMVGQQSHLRILGSTLQRTEVSTFEAV